MLTIYNSQAEVPEALREHYEESAGKWIPKVSDDHPLVVNNKLLLNEKNTAVTKAAGLESQVESLKADVQSAKASGLPRGHRAVTIAEADMIDKLKEHGTADEITAKLTEHGALKAAESKRKTEDNLRLVGKELGYTNIDAFIRLPNLPEFEIREKDGKKTVIAKVKGEGDAITEKPATEFIESSPEIAPFLSALKATTGTSVQGTPSGVTGNGGKDPFEWARDFGKQWNESQPKTDVAAAFGITK
jgi:hypothetical protein